MLKKIPSIKKEIDALNETKAALEAQQQALEQEILALEEEKKRDFEETKSKIMEACHGKYFCGVILTPPDIIAVVRLALETKENISIEFNLYPKTETSEETKDSDEPAGEEPPVIPIFETPEQSPES